MIDEQPTMRLLLSVIPADGYTGGKDDAEWPPRRPMSQPTLLSGDTRTGRLRASRHCQSPSSRRRSPQEEIDMRRMILRLMWRSILSEGGLYQKKRVCLANKLAGEKVAPTLAKLNIKYAETTAQRIDLPTAKLNISPLAAVQRLVDAVLTEQALPDKGVDYVAA